jgi:hypothetical protein
VCVPSGLFQGVRDYLANNGVPAVRLVGFGGREPVAEGDGERVQGELEDFVFALAGEPVVTQDKFLGLRA